MGQYVGTFKGYQIYVSDAKNKKYYALVDGKKVNFGDNRYQHYRDKMGYYSDLDHRNILRRKNYYSRHGKDAIKGSAKWFSHNILW